jgi:hypothetical protein
MPFCFPFFSLGDPQSKVRCVRIRGQKVVLLGHEVVRMTRVIREQRDEVVVLELRQIRGTATTYLDEIYRSFSNR